MVLTTPQAKNWAACVTLEEAKTSGLITSVKGDIQNFIDQRQFLNPEMQETDEPWVLRVQSLKTSAPASAAQTSNRQFTVNPHYTEIHHEHV